MPTTNPRIKVTLSEQSAASVKAAAQRTGQTLSEWIATLINERLQESNMPHADLPPRGEIMRTRNPRKRK